MKTLFERLLPRIAAPISAGAAARQSRRVFGIRLGALGEIVVFLALALVIDALWGPRNRFLNISPHPFWIVILLVSSYYGTREGLAAVLLSTAALLVGNLPDQRIDEDSYAWLLRSAFNPLCWCVAALVLGEIRDAMRRHLDGARKELELMRESARGMAAAQMRMKQLKDHFEARVAQQTCTVNAMYTAWSGIERHDIGDVLVGTMELARVVMSPQKFSLHLRNGRQLEAVVSEGWTQDDLFACTSGESSALYQAIVNERRVLVIADSRDQSTLADQGCLAGPLVNAATGELVGMLKIESIGFLDLNPTSIQNFRILCDWISAALGNAHRFEVSAAARSAPGPLAPSDDVASGHRPS